MKVSLTHPLWTHIPALVLLGVLLVALLLTIPLPVDAPVHFGPGGDPDRYGSPAVAFGLIVALSVGFIVLSVWIDELWSRQERKKTFNYFALLDEVVVGAMAGQGLGYLRLMQVGSSYSHPTGELVMLILPGAAAAFLIEKLRPFVPHETRLVGSDTSVLGREVSARLKSSSQFVYTDIQNPTYVSILSTAVPAILIVSAILQAATQPVWSTLLMVGVGLLLASFYGGVRTNVTRDGITVHVGTPGYRVLRMSPKEIADATLYDYMPLREFGGYGIRENRSMKGYFLSGGTGVLLSPTHGKKRLIGSNHPERLLAVVKTVAGY